MDILQNTNMDCSTVEAVALDRQTQPGQEITISSISEGISATRNTDSSKTQSMELDGDLNTQPDDPKDIALPDHKQAQKEANLAPPSALFPPLARSGTDTTANPRQPTPDEARRKTLNRRFPIYLPPLEIPASISHVTAASPILPTSHRTRPREDSLSSVGFGYRDTLLDFFQYDSDAAEASSPESSLYSGVMHEDDIDYVRPDSPTDSAYLNERTGVDDATGKGSRISSSLQEGENDCGGTTAVASGGWNRSQNSVESEIGGDSIENGTEFDSPPAIPHKSPLRNLKAYTLIAEASHRHQRETPAKDVVFEEQIRTDSNPPAIPLKSPLRDARLYARIAEASRRRHELNKSNNPRNHDISETMSQLHGSSTTQTSKVLPTSPVRATTSGSDNSVSPLACTLRERRRGGGNNDHMDAYNSFSRSRSPSSTKQKQFNRSQASADMKKLIPWTSVSPWASVGCAVGGDLLHAAYTTIPLRGGGPGYEHADSPATSTSFAVSSLPYPIYAIIGSHTITSEAPTQSKMKDTRAIESQSTPPPCAAHSSSTRRSRVQHPAAVVQFSRLEAGAQHSPHPSLQSGVTGPLLGRLRSRSTRQRSYFMSV